MQENLLAKIRESTGPNPGVELPPRIFKEMEGEFLEYIEDQSLTVRFPIKESYSNPFGFMQGGMIVAAPLSPLLLPPSITTCINTKFIRHMAVLTPPQGHYEIRIFLTHDNKKLASFPQGREASLSPKALMQILDEFSGAI